MEIDLLKLQDKDSKAGLLGEGGLCSSDMFVGKVCVMKEESCVV